MEGESKYLTTTEAGRILGCSRNHVKKLIVTGKLPAHLIGREYRIERVAVDQLLATLRSGQGAA